MADSRRPRQGGTPGKGDRRALARGPNSSAEQEDPAAQAAMESLAKEMERRIEQQRSRAPTDARTQAQRLKAEQARLQEALERQEAALREREPELSRDLAPEETPQGDWRERLKRALSKTRERWASGPGRLFLARGPVGTAELDRLEEALLAADVGPQVTARLVALAKERLKRHELADTAALQALVQDEIVRLMSRDQPPAPSLESQPPARPLVVLFVGVNGSGKTTTIGKLAAMYRGAGRTVLLAAGDTFRAAAAEQLGLWAQRTDADLFSKAAGSDPSAVLYQAVQKAIAEGHDLVLCDTAGRLHTKTHLMEELKKVKRVLGKVLPGAPHETWLVLDGNTGHNAIRQAREFHQALGLTGIVVTKLDGTA
ncbi:MAG: signal recognition particle-docking protein FtsY, partial [SAR324 cluster bacterium]